MYFIHFGPIEYPDLPCKGCSCMLSNYLYTDTDGWCSECIKKKKYIKKKKKRRNAPRILGEPVETVV